MPRLPLKCSSKLFGTFCPPFSIVFPPPPTSTVFLLSFHVFSSSHLLFFPHIFHPFRNFSLLICSSFKSFLVPLFNWPLKQFSARSKCRYLDVTSTHKPTTLHSDPHHTSTQHSVHCDNLLLWHFDPLTFYYCDRWTQWQFTTVTIRPLNILLLWQMDPVTIYYCDNLTP